MADGFGRRVVGVVPNGLTVSRLVLALAFPFLDDAARVPVFAYALATEWADGWLARKLDVISEFGRRLDPVADKAFVLGVLTTILLDGMVTLPEVLLVGLRDVAVFVACLVLLAMGRKEQLLAMSPRLLGKATTVVQFLFLGVVLVTGAAPAWLVGTAAALGAVAFVDSARAFPREKPASAGPPG